MNTSMLKLWQDAGLFARGIVVVLAIMSVYSLTIVIQKLMKIKKSEGRLGGTGLAIAGDSQLQP